MVRHHLRGASAVTVAGLTIGVLAAIAAPAGAAGSKASATLKDEFTAKGSSYVAKNSSTVKLGPATLKINLKPSGAYSGSLTLPTTTDSFTTAGLVTTTADVTFVSAGKVTGKLGSVKVGKKSIATVTSTSSYYLALSNVTAAGIPVPVGTTCQTSDPVTITAATPAGKKFNLDTGGVVKGTYTIGNFANCGLATTLINQEVPGSGNTVTLHLSDGRVAP